MTADKDGVEVTLYREIDALGGVREGEGEYNAGWHDGYTRAIELALEILAKRGFSEAEDASVSDLPVERLAYGYELMHRAICNMAGTSGADARWYYERANEVLKRVSPVFAVGPESNPSKPGDCLTGYRSFSNTRPTPAQEQGLSSDTGLISELTGYLKAFVDQMAEEDEEGLFEHAPDVIAARSLIAQGLARTVSTPTEGAQ